jgi:hypothetical protein
MTYHESYFWLKNNIFHHLWKFKPANRILFFFLVFGVFFYSCTKRSEWAKTVTWDDFAFRDLPKQEDYPDYGAIILLDEGKIYILGSPENRFSVFEKHRIVKVFNASGFSYANIAISYSPGSTVEKIFARTIIPSGKITVLDEHHIYDVTLFPEYVYFSDQRAKKFTFPAVENGSILEYRYTISMRQTTFGNSWQFQSAVPTLISRFILVKPAEWQVRYKVANIEVDTLIDQAQAGFKSKHKWEARNVPALDIESAMPSQNEMGGSLLIAPMGINSWDQIGEWYHDLITPQIKSTRSLNELANNLLEGMDESNEKLKILYEWVRDNIRYISVSIGIGGYQSRPAEEVLKNRYGDCKDMTTLLCALAGEAGIDMYQVLVSTRQNGLLDTSLATQSLFNHVIAYSPTDTGEGIWMDATEKGCPFRQLPWYDQGLQGLLVADHGQTKFIDTPLLPADSNLVNYHWQIRFDTAANAYITGRTEYRGAPAQELREELKAANHRDKKNWLEFFLKKRVAGSELQSFFIEGLDGVVDPLIISYCFYSETFTRQIAGGFTFFPADIMSCNLNDYFPEQSRKYPLCFRFGFLSEMTLEIKIPPDWQFAVDQFRDSLDTPFGSFFQNWSFSENSSLIVERYRLYGYEIKAAEYGHFKEFLKMALKKCSKEVMIKRR